MKTTTRSLAHLCAAVLLLALVSSPAFAVMITGEIGFTGEFTPDNADLSLAGTISFSNPISIGSTTGSFTTVSATTVTFSSLDFGTPTLPVTPLWISDGGATVFEFDLTSVSIDFANASSLVLSGTGIIKSAGFTDTPGNWGLTANTGGAVFNFSSTTAVPEPSGVLLFGAGLLLAGWTLRRRAL